uniref:Uncharacterized protein n=1 Tax=Anser brachyrhynchus TaxID=132585 RepID=A0A8B9BKG0_9AVES
PKLWQRSLSPFTSPVSLFPPDPAALFVNEPALVKRHCLPQEHVPAVEGVVLRCAEGGEHLEPTTWRRAQNVQGECRAAGLLCSDNKGLPSVQRCCTMVCEFV